MNELLEKYRKRLQKTERKVIILEQMIEDKTYNLYLQNQDLAKAVAEKDLLIEQIKNTQNHLIQTEKLAAIGQFTAGIAHEINNPLNYTSGCIEALALDFKDLKPLIEFLKQLNGTPKEMEQLMALKKKIDFPFLIQEIEQLTHGIASGIQKIKEIMRSIKFMSYQDQGEKQLMNVEDLIEAALTILKSKYKDRIIIEKSFQPLPLIEGYPGQLSQVFINIINNGIQAIGNQENGIILLKTKSSGDNIEISIGDNGPGMDEQTQSKIFDSFFTTKEIGKGTGLGLAISKNIILKHQGTIRVQSTVEQGSTFFISLPHRIAS